MSATFAVRIARIFAFGREGQMEIPPGFETRTHLEHFAQVLVGRAGIGGGFQHHELPFRRCRAMLLPVSRMKEMSGSRFL